MPAPPFESGLAAPTGRVYRHGIPGGQLSNLRQQALAMGVGDRFEEVEDAYERANALLGNIVKVTPSSKVVGDLAIFAVSGRIDWDELEQRPDRFDLPESVLGFLRGELGEPAGGLPQPFTERALRGCEIAPVRPGLGATDLERLEAPGPDRRAALSDLIFPGPSSDHRAAVERYGNVSVLPTSAFLYGLEKGREVVVDLKPGVQLVYALEAISDADGRGMRTVVARVNGQMRPIEVRDESVEVTTARAERADPHDPAHVGAPLSGMVRVLVAPGERVAAGQPVAVIEAMKMESTITAPGAGTVQRVARVPAGHLEQGDLILVLDHDGVPAATVG